MSRTNRKEGYHHRNLIDKFHRTRKSIIAMLWKLAEWHKK
jgi:hypothetical protein